MSSFGWMYSMASFVTTLIAVIVVVAFGYTIAVSNKQTNVHHLVDKMAGDEGED
jgi:ammonia channel protein AmtB